jgi:hypothetical protein
MTHEYYFTALLQKRLCFIDLLGACLSQIAGHEVTVVSSSQIAVQHKGLRIRFSFSYFGFEKKCFTRL